MTTLGPYYFAGAIFSLLASLFVIISYLKFKELRKHPSSVIYWRSMFDVAFSLQFIVIFGYSDAKYHCDAFSFIFQFAILGSQSWYFMIAMDLFIALRNPFTDSKSNMKMYHLIVWSTSLLSGIILVGSDNSDYRMGLETCWSKATGDQSAPNALNWILFFAPTLFYYFMSIGVIIYAYWRLRQGLDETFKVRTRILYNGLRYVVVFTIYWTVAGILYANIYAVETRNDGMVDASDYLNLYGAFSIVIAIRGLVDVSVWSYNENVPSAYARWLSGAGTKPDEQLADINRALRKEVLLYSTQGICEAVDRVSILPAIRYPTLTDFPNNLSPEESDKSIQKHELQRTDAAQKSPIPFNDYAPLVFRFLREKFGISEDSYKNSIKGDTNAMIEKFTEGASGSFFYFSEDGRYIVKTLTKGEAEFLITLLPYYTDYMASHPDSLLTKFLGFHSVKLYTLTLYFVVMESVFLTQHKIHARYDLKGSWIDRHASVKKGKVEGVFKDKDLTFKLSLAQDKRTAFLDAIASDSRFLASHNVMDYSLLLGIHKVRQRVIKEEAIPDSKKPDGIAEHAVPWFQKVNGGVPAKVILGPGLYFFGIIDILQEYNLQKKAERLAKTWLAFKDPDGISAVPPQPYCERFIKAMHDITEPEEEDAFSPRNQSSVELTIESSYSTRDLNNTRPSDNIALLPSK